MVCCIIRPWGKSISSHRKSSGKLIIKLPIQSHLEEIIDAIYPIATPSELKEIVEIWSSDDARRKYVKRGFSLHIELIQ